MTAVRPNLRTVLDDAFARREQAGTALALDARAVALACRSMAERFAAGGTLLVFGSGGPAADAAHVAVEFLHPVIVGKRALPALSLSADPVGVSAAGSAAEPADVFAASIRLFGRPSDIALGLSNGAVDPAVRRGLTEARTGGLLTVALAGGLHDLDAPVDLADHVLLARSMDPQVIKEVHVTTYHVLWELVHVFLEQSDRAA